MRNHKKKNEFCRTITNPYTSFNAAKLGERANTEAAEFTFSWLARSKHVFNGMNQARFLFTMLRQMELRNRYLSAKAASKRRSM